MKKSFLLVTLAALAASSHAPGAVVINEIYGGGGGTGATYTNDFIELYNNGLTAVDLSLYSLYYASAAGTFPTTGTTQITALTGTIAPNSTFLVQEAGGTTGTALPTPNQIGAINLSGTAGKVALALNGTVIAASNTTGVIDFVGYGTTANQFEGTAAAPAPSTTTSISRAALGLDTNQNGTDFTAGAPSPTSGLVPEPTTYAYVVGGLSALALLVRRRRTA